MTLAATLKGMFHVPKITVTLHGSPEPKQHKIYYEPKETRRTNLKLWILQYGGISDQTADSMIALLEWLERKHKGD